ncbi:MAG TPA: integrase [Prolixibacteraceae bacterium]|nr:integrase [Prolixibacteraceae bacterium]
MDEQIKDFNELIIGAENYLESQLHYSLKSVGNYRRCWKQTRNFMSMQGIKCYDSDVGELILRHKFGTRSKKELSTNEKLFFNSIKMLTDFQETRCINVPRQPVKELIIFKGEIGSIITDFLNKKIEKRLSKCRFHCYHRNLSEFLDYCNKKSVTIISGIDLTFILHFINEVSHKEGTNKTLMASLLTTIRGFMKFVFEEKYLTIDYSQKIPRYKSVRQPKLPSTYSKEEVEKLIKSVDRSTPTGKRNYVIILLAARLGLRASDICNLKFENLFWDTSTIKIEQLKTGKELELPMLPDIGNAIIDYLKYGRIQSDEPYVLLTARPPCEGFTTSNVVTHVVQRAFRKAGIDTNGRRFGPHSLRHSLGFRLLEKNTVLPLISEVLGHGNTESTRYYLRIDLESMKQCMLDVPLVPVDFYMQKGGAFYYG